MIRDDCQHQRGLELQDGSRKGSVLAGGNTIASVNRFVQAGCWWKKCGYRDLRSEEALGKQDSIVVAEK